MTRYISLGVVVVGLLIGMFGCWGTVPAGHRGVEVRMGKVTGTILEEGFYTKTPLVVSVYDVEVRVQKEQVQTEGASKDLQMVNVVAALNYNPEPKEVANLFKNVGMDYMQRIVDPAMQESIKAIIAQYTAEELITKREVVRSAVKLLLASKLGERGIKVDEFNIVNFNFSPAFNQAIEAKVTAVQQALAAEKKLAQVEFEAKQRLAEAEGKAKAMAVESAALAQNKEILQLRALEKWNGVLPTVTGGAVPFINVSPK